MVPGYTAGEKEKITEKYLVPQAIESAGLEGKED